MTSLKKSNQQTKFRSNPNKKLFKINDDSTIEFLSNNSEKVERLFSMLLDSSNSLTKRNSETNIYKIQRAAIHGNSMPNYEKKMKSLKDRATKDNIKIEPIRRPPFNFDYSQDEAYDQLCNNINFPPW